MNRTFCSVENTCMVGEPSLAEPLLFVDTKKSKSSDADDTLNAAKKFNIVFEEDLLNRDESISEKMKDFF